MGWDGNLLVLGWETSGAGIGWYMTRDKNCWDGDGIEWGVMHMIVPAVTVSAEILGSVMGTIRFLPT